MQRVIIGIVVTLIIVSVIGLFVWDRLRSTSATQNSNQSVALNLNKNTNQAGATGVTVTTDKTEYQPGEKVTITITDHQSESIYQTDTTPPGRSWGIYQLVSGQWREVVTGCECGPTCTNGTLQSYCPMYDLEAPQYNYAVFPSPQEVEWQQTYCSYQTRRCGTTEYQEGLLVQSESGQYRAQFCYWDKVDVDLTVVPGRVTPGSQKCVEREFTIQ